MTDPLEEMPERVERDMADQQAGRRRGELAVFTCPECGGAMWQVDQPELTRFSCHVGHAYYGEDLLEEQSLALEAALWTAVRTFKEKAVLARQLAARERERGNLPLAKRFEEDAQVAQDYGDLIQVHVLKSTPTPPTGEAPQPGQAPAGESGAPGMPTP
jgi:two-component system chemotaxis response regulator CheB